jgi:ABC-type spermidine/putrescine transport system, permease component II
MPGQLGKATALLAASSVSRRAADSDDDHDVVQRGRHARIPAARLRFALVSRGVAQLRLAGCERLALDGRRAQHEPDRRALDMVIATLVSVPAAYALSRYRFRGKPAVEQLVALPLVYPLVMLGLSLLLVFNVLPIELGVFRLIIAHVILALPFTVKNCAASVASIGPEFEEAPA